MQKPQARIAFPAMECDRRFSARSDASFKRRRIQVAAREELCTSSRQVPPRWRAGVPLDGRSEPIRPAGVQIFVRH
eukprot:3011456-Pyramimonas_sp.AAC.1